MLSNAQAVEDLRWKKIPLLSDGFVCLVDAMGDDAAICQAARVSYNNDAREGDTTAGESDRNLIRYLMRHRHTTPFEQCEVKLLIRIPMDAHRQLIRHRMASVNEYSTRYVTAIDSKDITPSDAWRLQATSNKQGSSGLLTEWPEGWSVTLHTPEAWSGDSNPSEWRVFAPDPVGDEPPVVQIPYSDLPVKNPSPGEVLSVLESQHHGDADHVYKLRLSLGVAREQARKDLPLATYTELYWKMDLHNLMHFLGLRMDSHAQLEIRSYANAIGEQIVAKLFPLAWEAFQDYRTNAKTLTALDRSVIRTLVASGEKMPSDIPPYDSSVWPEEWRNKPRHRERDECVAKLRDLLIFEQ